MLLYAITIGSSTLMFALSGYTERHKKRILSIISLAIAILIPCIVVGARDVNVGTDTAVYGIPFYREACNAKSFSEFSHSFRAANTEWLYKLFSYYTAKLFKSEFLYLLFPELIIFLLVLSSVNRITNKRYVWLGMLMFELLFLSYSMNLMRQTIAIAVYLYSFKYVEEKKSNMFLLLSIISFLIQMTSIIGVAIYPLYWATQYYNQQMVNAKRSSIWKFTSRYKSFLKLITIIVVAFAMANLQRLLTAISLFTGRYSSQIRNITGESLNDFRYLIFCIPCLALIYLCKRKRANAKVEFFLYLFLLSVMLYQCRQITLEAYRISLYFSAFLVLLIPEIAGSIKNKGNRVVFVSGNIWIWSAYFYFYFIRWQWNMTYPYKSHLLGL